MVGQPGTTQVYPRQHFLSRQGQQKHFYNRRISREKFCQRGFSWKLIGFQNVNIQSKKNFQAWDKNSLNKLGAVATGNWTRDLGQSYQNKVGHYKAKVNKPKLNAWRQDSATILGLDRPCLMLVIRKLKIYLARLLILSFEHPKYLTLFTWVPNVLRLIDWPRFWQRV